VNNKRTGASGTTAVVVEAVVVVVDVVVAATDEAGWVEGRGRIAASSRVTSDVGGPAADPTEVHEASASTGAITHHGAAPDLTARAR
jgi:hypothetical protein